MKISFPKYGPGELLTRKRLATCIISFVALAVFAGVCGSYLLGNKWWLLTIAVLGIAASARQAPLHALTTEIVGAEVRGEYTAMRNAASQIGIATAAAISAC